MMRPSVKPIKRTPLVSKSKIPGNTKENDQASNKPKVVKRGSEISKASPATSIGKKDSIPAASR